MILPNATKYTNTFDKNIPQNKIEQLFLGRSTGLQGEKLIAIDFWTGCPKIKATILVKFSTFYQSFFLLVDISLLLPLLTFFLFLLQENEAQI